MMLEELKFNYPEKLVALSPQRPSRVLWHEAGENSEISLSELLARIPAGDFLLVNNTKVIKRRVFTEAGEILFLSPQGTKSDQMSWQVLFPAKRLKLGDKISLPLGRIMTLIEKGRPQLVSVDGELTEDYFSAVGELPLPPYIQKLRPQRHALSQDEKWYQSAFAKEAGSLAAPTASLHFAREDLALLQARGVKIRELTLHVGLGTFLPVLTDNLDLHPMHEETYSLNPNLWEELLMAKLQSRTDSLMGPKPKIWALGTTVTRVLESVARSGKFSGKTDILLQVGSEFKMVDRLMTNFHQPESTLLALVMGFAGREEVIAAYSWAIEREFRLFSYGDLSVWIR